MTSVSNRSLGCLGGGDWSLDILSFRELPFDQMSPDPKTPVPMHDVLAAWLPRPAPKPCGFVTEDVN